ncbi:rod shape-determining protein MreD [Loktanella sp. Alg231-35]|uniref:rod shape-determining protein MreD n=1 Tax=Loktanella sp. Alg231-35 TaxID=1922220 RepID=UPI000D55BF5D|nr:rod shape-determining protein MreD [Loktanella sp. Alg231-35]
MAERADTHIWMHRGLFALLAFAIIVVQLVPLDMRPSVWAGPDLLLAVTLVWIARKPKYLPVPVIAGFFLMADFLFMRPPGLWPALVVVLTEIIRRQHRDFRNMQLLVEWGTVAIGIIGITLANRLVLAIVVAPQAPLALTLTEMVATILVYPVVVILAHYIFGVTRSAPGEVGKKGQRL